MLQDVGTLVALVRLCTAVPTLCSLMSCTEITVSASDVMFCLLWCHRVNSVLQNRENRFSKQANCYAATVLSIQA